MKKIKPLNNRVLVKRLKARVTQGGIYLPDSAQEKPKEGEVIAKGPGARSEDGIIVPMTVNVGDRVFFSSYAGTEVKNSEGSDDEYLIMSEEDILGVVVV
jgi:chaperonin GroES